MAPAVEPVKNGLSINLPAVTTSFTRAQLAELQAPIPPPAPIVPDPPAPSITLTFGLDANAMPLPTDQAAPWAGYDGGIMPTLLADFVRTTWRRSGLTQQQLADRVEISRPQLATALAGRFGLSRDAAARLCSALPALPASPQGMLL